MMHQTSAYLSHQLSAGSSQGAPPQRRKDLKDQKEQRKQRRASIPAKATTESASSTIATKTRRRLSGEYSLISSSFWLSFFFYVFTFQKNF